MPEDTSPGTGATPEPVSPATGTPAPAGATPPVAALTLEEALKKLADYEHSQSNAKEELERHRKKLSAYEKAEAEREAQKKAEADQQLSEIERVKKQHAELQAQHTTYTQQMQERIVRYEVERQANKLGIIDPDAAARLLDWAELEYDEDGTPKNATKLLETLIKNKPYLAAKTESVSNTPAQPVAPTPPAIPAMNPGRQSIPAPTRQPGQRPPSIGDAYRMNKR